MTDNPGSIFNRLLDEIKNIHLSDSERQKVFSTLLAIMKQDAKRALCDKKYHAGHLVRVFVEARLTDDQKQIIFDKIVNSNAFMAGNGVKLIINRNLTREQQDIILKKVIECEGFHPGHGTALIINGNLTKEQRDKVIKRINECGIYYPKDGVALIRDGNLTPEQRLIILSSIHRSKEFTIDFAKELLRLFNLAEDEEQRVNERRVFMKTLLQEEFLTPLNASILIRDCKLSPPEFQRLIDIMLRKTHLFDIVGILKNWIDSYEKDEKREHINRTFNETIDKILHHPQCNTGIALDLLNMANRMDKQRLNDIGDMILRNPDINNINIKKVLPIFIIRCQEYEGVEMHPIPVFLDCLAKQEGYEVENLQKDIGAPVCPRGLLDNVIDKFKDLKMQHFRPTQGKLDPNGITSVDSSDTSSMGSVVAHSEAGEPLAKRHCSGVTEGSPRGNMDTLNGMSQGEKDSCQFIQLD